MDLSFKAKGLISYFRPLHRTRTKCSVRLPSSGQSSSMATMYHFLSRFRVYMTRWLTCLQILCMIGQYDIWVRKGVISILGAMLHPSSRLHRVYAPSTQSLPYIRPVPNPYGSANQATELTIITCSSGIRALRHLSPKFGRIWNAKLAHDVAVLGSIDRSRRSYAFVSPINLVRMTEE